LLRDEISMFFMVSPTNPLSFQYFERNFKLCTSVKQDIFFKRSSTKGRRVILILMYFGGRFLNQDRTLRLSLIDQRLDIVRVC